MSRSVQLGVAVRACALLAVACSGGRPVVPSPDAVPPPPSPPGAQLPASAAAEAERFAPPPPARGQPMVTPPRPASLGAPLARPAAAEAAQEACVDRELARRGLNAYGDLPGTAYDGGSAPAGASGGRARLDRVLARVPEIRTACSAGSDPGG